MMKYTVDDRGYYGKFGGAYIPEMLYPNVEELRNNYLKIIVENPFDPSSAPPNRGTGFGLNSIQRRLYLLYGRNDLLTTAQNSVIFTTELKIPQSA